MKISVTQYSQALYDLTYNKSETEVVQVLKEFLDALIKNNDFVLVDRIIEAFNSLIKKASGILEIEIITARPLSKSSDAGIKEYLANKSGASEVEILEEVEPSILGGFILRYGDKVVDASLKQSLLSFEKQISN